MTEEKSNFKMEAMYSIRGDELLVILSCTKEEMKESTVAIMERIHERGEIQGTQEGHRMSATTFAWYCPHCGKRQDGGARHFIIEHMEHMNPLVYGLCDECIIKHHRWMEGEDGME